MLSFLGYRRSSFPQDVRTIGFVPINGPSLKHGPYIQMKDEDVHSVGVAILNPDSCESNESELSQSSPPSSSSRSSSSPIQEKKWKWLSNSFNLQLDEAKSLVASEKFDEALTLLKEVFQVKCTLLGEEHPLTLKTLEEMAKTEASRRNFDEALTILEGVYQSKLKKYGIENESTLQTLEELAKVHAESESYFIADGILRLLLAHQKELHGPSDAKVINTRCHIAKVLFQQKRTKEAEEIIDELLKDGYTHETRNQVKEAKAFYSRARDWLVFFCGPDHHSTLSATHRLATAVYKLGAINDAEKMYEDLIVQIKNTHGNSHVTILTPMRSLASTYRVLGKLEDAERVYKELLPLEMSIHGPKHDDTLKVMERLNEVILDIKKNKNEMKVIT